MVLHELGNSYSQEKRFSSLWICKGTASALHFFLVQRFISHGIKSICSGKRGKNIYIGKPNAAQKVRDGGTPKLF